MKFIFIGGCPRSGTTLVQKMLLLNSQVTGGGGFDFLPALFQVYDHMINPDHIDKKTFFYNEELLKEGWRKFIESLLLKQPGKENYKYLSEKTPKNIEVAAHLLELFPDSKFIYIYRDGRDVINSFREARTRARKGGHKAYIDLTKSAFRWNTSAFCYKEICDNRKFDGRHLSIKYEDLVNDPPKNFETVMRFLDLPLEKEQLTPEKADDKSLNMHIDGIWYTDTKFQQKINAENIGKWKRGLNPFQKFKAQVIIAPYLIMYKYPVNPVYYKLHLLFKKLYSLNKN